MSAARAWLPQRAAQAWLPRAAPARKQERLLPAEKITVLQQQFLVDSSVSLNLYVNTGTLVGVASVQEKGSGRMVLGMNTEVFTQQFEPQILRFSSKRQVY